MNVKISQNGKVVDVTLSERNLNELHMMWTNITKRDMELVPSLLRRVETGEFLSVRIEPDEQHYAGR